MARTKTNTGMNGSSYPAADGRHFIAAPVIKDNNWGKRQGAGHPLAGGPGPGVLQAVTAW